MKVKPLWKRKTSSAVISNREGPSLFLSLTLSHAFLFMHAYNVFTYIVFGKFHSKSSRKNPNLHHPPQSFFFFGFWLDALNLERNPKFQVLGSSGTLIFNRSELGPWPKKWLPRCGNRDYPILADFNFWKKFLPNNPRNWTWKALEVEKSKNLT